MMTGWLSTAERASGNHRNAKREPAWMESKNKGSWKNINQSSSEEFSINFLPTTNYTRKDFNSFQIFYFLLRHNFQFPAVCAMVYSLDEFFVRPPTPFISALIESRELLDSIHSPAPANGNEWNFHTPNAFDRSWQRVDLCRERISTIHQKNMRNRSIRPNTIATIDFGDIILPSNSSGVRVLKCRRLSEGKKCTENVPTEGKRENHFHQTE